MGNKLCSCGNKDDANAKNEADLNTRHNQLEQNNECLERNEIIEKQKAGHKRGTSDNENEINNFYYGASLRESELANNSLYLNNNSYYISGNNTNQKNKSDKSSNPIYNAIHTEDPKITEIFIVNQANKIINTYKKYQKEKNLKNQLRSKPYYQRNNNYDKEDKENKDNNNTNLSDNPQNNSNVIDPNKSIYNIPSFITITSSKTSKTILSSTSNFGIRHYINKSIYIGEFVADKCTGYGKYITNSNDIINGEFHCDALNGYCVISRSEGASYEGEIRINLLEGIGTEHFSDGSSYSGTYKNNAKSGIGTYQWANGSKYIGEWKKNMPNGAGIYTYYDGRTYEGEWKNGKMEGIGCFKWKDGKKFFGSYEGDRRSGFGIFIWKNPFRIYVGFWRDGKQFGFGKVITSVKERYCIWKNGKREREFGNKEIFYEDMRRSFDGAYGRFEMYFKMSLDEIISVMIDW